MAKIGQGLLKMVSGLLGTIIVGFKSVGYFLKALTLPSDQRDKVFDEILAGIKVQTDTVVAGVEDIKVGGKGVFVDLKKAMETIFPNLDKALGLDVKVPDIGAAELGIGVANKGGEAIANKIFGGDSRPEFYKEVNQNLNNMGNALFQKIGQLDNKEAQREIDKNVQDLIYGGGARGVGPFRSDVEGEIRGKPQNANQPAATFNTNFTLSSRFLKGALNILLDTP
jgi:hypothetical protein